MTRVIRRVLGIESSCDETAVALLEDGRRLLGNRVASQVEEHARFGGVVPEIASRQHLLALFPLVDATLADAGLGLEAVDAVAVTRAPGLIGALLVGISAAKALAYTLDVPLVGVNHLEGHLLAARLLDPAPEYPFLGLVVSGGHTALYRVEAGGCFTYLAGTRDDAAGEAFDKAAKIAGLGYPGGAVIDRLAKEGDPKAVPFPRGMGKKATMDFSFSGLKTAFRERYLSRRWEGKDLADLCASFQEAIADTLAKKTALALRETGLGRLVVSGGVAANSRVRSRMTELARKEGAALFLPPLWLCGDNAAMIALAGHERLMRGERDGFDLNAAASESRFS